jgi:hypothetical protein
MRYHLLVLLILLVFSSHAQSSKSQIDSWNASFYETYDQDLDKAFLLAKRALKESKKSIISLAKVVHCIEWGSITILK